jgi:hypothetical protein
VQAQINREEKNAWAREEIAPYGKHISQRSA